MEGGKKKVITFLRAPEHRQGFLLEFGGFRGREGFKKARGTRGMNFPLLRGHMNYSRPISTQFCHFFVSPFFAYFCQNPPRGAISHFSKTHVCSAQNYLAPIRTCASKFAFDGYGKSAKPLYESRVIQLSVRKPKYLAKIRRVDFPTK